MCHHAVQPPMDVEPTDRPFPLPSLAARAPRRDIFRRATAREGDLVLPRGGKGTKAALAQPTAVRFALVAFVQAQAFGLALALADAHASEGLQQLDKVSAVGFTQGEVEWVALGGEDQRAFEPFKPGFSGVPALGVRPFLDLPTRASGEQFLRFSMPRRSASLMKSATMRCQTRR